VSIKEKDDADTQALKVPVDPSVFPLLKRSSLWRIVEDPAGNIILYPAFLIDPATGLPYSTTNPIPVTVVFGTTVADLELPLTSWAIFDSQDNAAASAANPINAFMNRLKTKITLIDPNNAIGIVYDIATLTFTTISAGVFRPLNGFTVANQELTVASVQGTYTAFMNLAATEVQITKDGALIQQLTLAALGLNSVSSVSITWDGQYIVIHGVRTASGNPGFVILQGT